MERINWLDFKETSNKVSEAYRAIRSNLLAAITGKEIQVIEITSPKAFEDKSAVIAGLSIVLAQSGKKVLLVDCNFPAPVQHILFGLPNRGITNCLTDGEDLSAGIQLCPEQENLDLLTVGSDVSSLKEIQVNESLQGFLETVRKQYEFILLDVPSLETAVDAMVIAPKTDGALLVVAGGEDRLNDLIDAKDKLEQAGAMVLGCVLDKVKV